MMHEQLYIPPLPTPTHPAALPPQPSEQRYHDHAEQRTAALYAPIPPEGGTTNDLVSADSTR